MDVIILICKKCHHRHFYQSIKPLMCERCTCELIEPKSNNIVEQLLNDKVLGKIFINS
jgi:hypothetical protein